MGFSDAKIAPSPPYTPPGTILMREGFVPQFSTVVPHLRTVPPLAARCSVAAHCASRRVLATSALRAFGRSQARLRLSYVPTIRNSRLATLPLAKPPASFALIGLPLRLFRALRAAKLRPTGCALRAPLSRSPGVFDTRRRRDKPPPLIVEKWDRPRFYAPFARLGSESSKKSKLAHTTLAPVGKSKR